MAFIDYYKILGISEIATDKDIKAAYRKQDLKYPPDLNPDNKEAELKLKEITDANEVLSDTENGNIHAHAFGKFKQPLLRF